MKSRRMLALKPGEQAVYDKRQAGMGFKEIAEEMGITHSQAQNWYERGSRKLKQQARLEAQGVRKISF